MKVMSKNNWLMFSRIVVVENNECGEWVRMSRSPDKM
jgi:hypothetical protein